MPYRILLVVLAAAGLPFPSEALAQGPTAAEAAALHRLAAGPPATSATIAQVRRPVSLPDSVRTRTTDYTVVGLLIGAGLGFAGSWAFYDLLCEAVDNRCGDSRFRLVIPATAVGGLLGAAIGSLAQ
jgi:hypothetical protein